MNSEQFNQIQKDILSIRAQSSERIGWFAGATISLSLTLLGFLLSKDSFLYIMMNHRWLLFVLIAGWVLLGVSIVLSFTVRILGSMWLRDSASRLYFFENNEDWALKIDEAAPGLEDELKKRTKQTLDLLRWFEFSIYLCGIVGIILLLSFLIGLVLVYFSYPIFWFLK